MSTYVCSDIHGEFNTWLLALENCGISLENGDNLLILGDLIDRGTDSLACVKFAFEMIERYPNQVTYLMGNHEKMFLDFVQINYANDVNGYMNIMISGQQWVRNGGLTTIKSFLGEIPESIFETHKKLNEKFPALINQLAGLPYYMVDNAHNCVYVHAGFESNTLLKDQNEDEMLWIREPFFDCFKPIKGDVLDGRLIVHGHTPVQYIKAYKGEGFYQGKHHICIDGGAARSEKILIVKMDDFSYTSQSIKSDVTTSI